MKTKDLNKKNIEILVLFILIFGNVFLNKAFASIKIGSFLYINEILLFTLFLALKNSLKVGVKFLLILLPIPLYSIFNTDYEIYNILKDYAILYYPYVIFVFLSNDKKLPQLVREVILKYKFLYPYLPLYYFISYFFASSPLRATEAVCFSLIFFYYCKFINNYSYSKFEEFLFYTFLFFLSLQHRSSILILIFLLIYLIIFKFKKSNFLLIALSAIFCISFYLINEEFNILEMERGIEEIQNRNNELTNATDCSQDKEENISQYLNVTNTSLSQYPKDYFLYLCGWSNIEWRLVLWSSSLNELNPVINNLFKNTLGQDLILTGVDEKLIPEYMVQNSVEKLRNLHNTFLTFLVRFGFFPFLLTIILLTKLLLNNYRHSFPIFLVFIQSFFDPILDGPVMAIPFYLLFFSTILLNKIKMSDI